MALNNSLNITQQEILQYHLGGKIGLKILKRLADKRSLSIAYTPGVATPCLIIRDDPNALFKYTAKGNLVAIITDGTAVLGLGDIGARASIPVMEGKAILFKAFAKIDGWPVPLENCRTGGNSGQTQIDKVIDYAAGIACMYGGINLEDIAAPACFKLEERLQERVDCPVFHDDQWGTAIITLAALKNYIHFSEKSIEDMFVVINGAGAAGIRIAEMLKSEGVRHLLLLDSKGVIHSHRTDINPYKRRFVSDTTKRTLSDALKGADVFIGVSRPNLVTGEMILSMGDYPGIFAMSNPEPEIRPERVKEVMGKRPFIMATGRSDYPNQINNVLGFPYIFRGALDIQAKSISMSMKKAAAEALSQLARSDAPGYLKEAYPDEELFFGPDYIIPKPFDKRLLVEVSYAVAEAAYAEGLASISDIEHYRDYLKALAYAPESNSTLHFVIEGCCNFSRHTICFGHTPEGEKGTFICSPFSVKGICESVRNGDLLGRVVKLIIRDGMVAGHD